MRRRRELVLRHSPSMEECVGSVEWQTLLRAQQVDHITDVPDQHGVRADPVR